MSSANDLQSLLRFLAQDAKVPLALAISKVKKLQEAKLTNQSEISKSDVKTLQAIFGEEKLSKQIINAAKRVTKKRSADSDGTEEVQQSANKKRQKATSNSDTAVVSEEDLALPPPCLDEELLSKTTLFVNRAPLLLAFVVVLLRYTFPKQPLSSRLSLSQAVVSANSRTKAKSLGIEPGRSAEEDGWGQGQPVVEILGRKIRVMKRWGYSDGSLQAAIADENDHGSTQNTLLSDGMNEDEPALWAIDLEALKNKDSHGSEAKLPIYTARSARSYLLKSFDSASVRHPQSNSSKKRTAADIMAEKECNLGYILGAIQLLYESWSSTLSKTDLDKRAWSWYVRVRPEVETGIAGWGRKNDIKLSDILDLRRT